MKKKLISLFFIMFLITLLTGCNRTSEQSKPEPVNLTVAAAASLKDAMEELKTVYVQKNPGINITYNSASSGILQKQIEEGAPVDLFISAGMAQMDAIADKGLIVEASRKDLLGNELVLITNNDGKITDFNALAGKDIARVSIGTPETVPAGMYAKETLTSLKLWDKIKPKLVMAGDVRQVLTYVENGDVDAGLVYRSDTVVGKNIKIVATAPEDSHKPIVYPMAIIKNSKAEKEAGAFATFLSSDEAAQIFSKYGFTTIKK